MKLIRRRTLTQQQTASVHRLTELCSRTDRFATTAETECDPAYYCFFYIMEEESSDCPAAFLSCMLLKDGSHILPDATFTLHVRPDVRRHGLGRMLYDKMLQECRLLCAVPAVTVHTCTGPEGDGFAGAMAMGFHTDAAHLLMNLPLPAKEQSLTETKSDASVTFRPCRNRRTLASLYRRIFPAQAASARMAIDEILTMPQAGTFVLFQEKQAVGMAMTLAEADSAYLFNFGILPEFRRRHLALTMFTALLSYLPQSVRNLQLQVDRENSPALLLYEKLGFRTVTELLELSTTLI